MCVAHSAVDNAGRGHRSRKVGEEVGGLVQRRRGMKRKRVADIDINFVQMMEENVIKPNNTLIEGDINGDGVVEGSAYAAIIEQEDDSEAEEEEEEEEEEEGGTYKFRFDGEMDPLDFAEDDAFGVQPYQQFERWEHEYEVLAAKKRKSLAQHHPQ
ncbi:hypothetical protein LguiA_009282 [Lonicera macranthoides]